MNAPFSPLDRTDEIDLIDLWLIFKRRWQWLVPAIGLSLAAVLGWGSLQKPTFTYQISLQLGAVIMDGQVVSLEEPEAVQAAVLQRSSQGGRPAVTVNVERGSEVITLSRTGSEAQVSEIKAQLTSQAQAILAEQARTQAAYQAQVAALPSSMGATVLYRPARVLGSASLSAVNAPLSLPILGLLGLVLGFMSGCGAILLAEFAAAVRRREQRADRGQPSPVKPERKPMMMAGARHTASRQPA